MLSREKKKKKMLVPWKEGYDKPRQHIKKRRHHFADKGMYSQNYGFSSRRVQMWALDIKKAECWTIDAFKLWCWRSHLRVPWTARSSNQSIIKEINPDIHLKDWCWSWSSNTLATWCKEPTHWRRPWCWERLKAKGEGGGRGQDGWIVLSLNGINPRKLWKIVKDRGDWHAVVHGVTNNWTRLSNWTTMT